MKYRMFPSTLAQQKTRTRTSISFTYFIGSVAIERGVTDGKSPITEDVDGTTGVLKVQVQKVSDQSSFSYISGTVVDKRTFKDVQECFFAS